MKNVKVIIPVIVVIAIIAGIAGYVVLSGKVAISGLQKAGKGLDKAFDAFEETEGVLEENEGYKYLKNLYSNPSETELSFNVKANIEDLEDIIGDKDSAKLIEDILDEIANCNVITKMSMDRENKKLVTSLELDAKDIIGNISGEAVITDKEIAFRSKDINQKFLKVNRDEDEEELEEMFKLIDEFFANDYSNFEFTDAEIKHFKTTYGDIFRNSVKDDMITTNDDKITVDGKERNCSATKVHFDNENVRKLLNTYVDTFINDEKGREILVEKFEALYSDELLIEMFDLDGKDKVSKELDEKLVEAAEDLKDELEDLEDVEFNYTTFGTSTEVFANEYEVIIDKESAKLLQTFNSKGENYILKVEDEEILDIDVTRNKDEISIDGKMDIDGTELKFELVISDTVCKLVFNSEDIGTIELNISVDTKKNTNKELAQDMVIVLKADIPDIELKGDITVTMSEKINIVDSIDVPDTSKAIDVIEDEDKLEDYLTDSQEALEKYLEKFEKSNIYKIFESYNSVNSYSNYNSYGDYSWDDYDFNY